MKRIGYLTSEYPAVSHTFIRREIAALREHGLSITPFSIRPAAAAASPLEQAARAETQAVLGRSAFAYLGACLGAAGHDPRRFFATFGLALRHRVRGMRPALWSIFHFIEAMMLARLMRAEGIGHLHSHFANSGATVGMLATSYLGIPWSMTLHGISETDYPAGALLGDKIARARFVACASSFMRAQAMRVSPPDLWHKFAIAHCIVDLSALPEPSLASAAEDVTFICVGRLSPEKGHVGLLTAFADVRRAVPGVRLRLVGGGPLHDDLIRAIDRLGIADEVTLLGPLDEQATLAEIARADVLVLASFMEGLPVVLIEALALGKPVVASRVAGIPELVGEGQNGLMFAPSDWAALAAAMIRIARDPALRARYGDAGRETVAAGFTATAMVPQLAALLQEDADAP